MTRVAVVSFSDEGAARLLQPLRRHGFETMFVAAVDARTGLRDLDPEVALIEFSAAARTALDSVIEDKMISERLALIAVLPADELAAYEGGGHADDFVVWPVAIEELVARIRVAHRRRRGLEPEHVLRFGELTIDLANYRVTVSARPVELTFKEYELLRFLAGNRDKVFTREALLNRVWGYDYYGGARTVDVHIRRLRAKIEDGHHTFIETIRNVGYRFNEHST